LQSKKNKKVFSDKNLQEAFNQHAKLMEVKEGDVIMLPGQYIKIIPIVEKGCIRVLRQNKLGEETFFTILWQGKHVRFR
jgi:CRP/FNR family transcriptional regulator